jgi:hypothetical protein
MEILVKNLMILEEEDVFLHMPRFFPKILVLEQPSID